MVKFTELESLNNTQLVALARARGVALPRGRLSKPTLLKALREAALERKAERRQRRSSKTSG
jgi:hypothetical protein